VIIRPATLDDWGILSIFIEESNREQHILYGVPDWTRAHLEAVHAAIAGELGGVYLAIDEHTGQPVGMTAMVSFPMMPVGLCEGITTYIHPKYRRTKVGHQLGEAAREFHRANGITECRGSVYLANKPSVERCLAEGAEIIGFLLRYPFSAEERAALPPQDAERVVSDACPA
jgi:GNAT superfamily N-acetyltransferase